MNRTTRGPGSARRRVELHNRPWNGIPGLSLMRGLDPRLTPDALRDVFRRLHAADPLAAPVCRLEGSPLRWVAVPDGELEAWLEQVVVDARGRTPEDAPTTVQRWVDDPMGARAIRVVVGDGYHVVQTDHVIGDGAYGWSELTVGLLRHALDGTVPTGLARATHPVSPLLRAGWHSLVRHPRRDTWREAHARWKAGGARPLPGPGIRLEPTGRISLVTRRGVPGPLEELRGWRDENLPGTSMAVLTMAAGRMALEAEGVVDAGIDSVVMFDARRFLPEGARVVGNFSGALRLTDPTCADPRAMGEEIRRDISLALPLVSMLAFTAASLVPQRLVPSGGPRRRGPVVLTHMGAIGWDDLPWTAPEEEREVLSAGIPAGGTGTTVFTTEWQGRMMVTVCSDSTAVEEKSIVRSAERLVADPIGVLTEGMRRG